MTNPDYYPDRITDFFIRRALRFNVGPDETLTPQLERAGYSAADVQKAVISHLHFDHAGGIGEIPQADLVVSSTEWQDMLRPHPERRGVLRRDIEIQGAKWHQITYEPTEDPSIAPFTHAFDLMGDGSMLLVPTPGHSPGSLSMLLRRDGAPPMLFVGDLCYSLDLLLRDRLPARGDKKMLRPAYAKVRALKERMPDLVILPTHDPGAAAALRGSTT
jgi:glyoxylase-like metal-dependent hydrolase (beta-lactamase superfamily II)